MGVHNVEWDTSNGTVANWSAPVGMNASPIHGPRVGSVPVAEDEHDCERSTR